MLKKFLWNILGITLLLFAYIGLITPGVPATVFTLLAAWSFSKSSPKLNRWLHDHPIFGKNINNWEQKKIYPNRGRYSMVGVMLISLITIYLTLETKIFIITFTSFFLICIWAFRYPGSEEEYNQRIKNGDKIGWLK
tara:strand:+ start:404 stop:814 length:411 start_codon:yes stop_codon:yes gene_type:complete